MPRLRYISDTHSGISRKAYGKKLFGYFRNGRPYKQREGLLRIHNLVIPPAWTEVWISPAANSHLQATGRDARGRKQYLYHEDFRENQDHAKFTNLIPFARSLPRIRRRVRRDLQRPGLPREKVLAAIVELLEHTLIRVGNSQYAEENHSFGLSTLLNRHVHKKGNHLQLVFMGKSGVKHEVDINDSKLAQIVRKCHDLPGQHLFEYRDGEGKIHAVHSSDVNDYIRVAADAGFTAKNFRTWWGTVFTALAFEKIAHANFSNKLVAAVIKEVAGRLRNTPAICRKYYIHPAIVTAVVNGNFSKKMQQARLRSRQQRAVFSKDEAAVLWLLINQMGHRDT